MYFTTGGVASIALLPPLSFEQLNSNINNIKYELILSIKIYFSKKFISNKSTNRVANKIENLIHNFLILYLAFLFKKSRGFFSIEDNLNTFDLYKFKKFKF